MTSKNLPVTVRSIPFWNSLLDSNLEYLEQGFDYPVFGVETVKELLNKIENFYQRKEVWLIQHGANICGIFAVGNFPESLEGKDNWFETVVYIHPEYRGLGIAKLLTLSTAKAFENKNANLVIEVRTDNDASLKAHAKIFPEIKPVLVNNADFDAYQWRVADENKVEVETRWLAEELGYGISKLV